MDFDPCLFSVSFLSLDRRIFRACQKTVYGVPKFRRPQGRGNVKSAFFFPELGVAKWAGARNEFAKMLKNFLVKRRYCPESQFYL